MNQTDDETQDKIVRFIIKSKSTDYLISFTKKGPEVQYERASAFSRFNKHMVFPQSLEITIDRTAETIKQVFFLQKMSGRVNFIYPLHSSKEENISSDIKNKQEEVSKHIESKFLQNENGKVVYQDSEFAFMESDEFKNLILSELNPKTDFQNEDEYISTRDMMLKVNYQENVIHIWSMKPQFEYISFRETITEMQDNESKLLQNIIL